MPPLGNHGANHNYASSPRHGGCTSPTLGPKLLHYLRPGWTVDANGLPCIEHYPERIACKRGLFFGPSAPTTDALCSALAFHVRAPLRTEPRETPPTLGTCPPALVAWTAGRGWQDLFQPHTASTLCILFNRTTGPTSASPRPRLSRRPLPAPQLRTDYASGRHMRGGSASSLRPLPARSPAHSLPRLHLRL